MVQIKKPDIRQAILEGAFTSFSRNGYASTSIADIAAAANITASNVYVYFPSKLHILYDIYRPWLTDQLLKLQKSIRRLRSPVRSRPGGSRSRMRSSRSPNTLSRSTWPRSLRRGRESMSHRPIAMS